MMKGIGGEDVEDQEIDGVPQEKRKATITTNTEIECITIYMGQLNSIQYNHIIDDIDYICHLPYRDEQSLESICEDLCDGSS